MKISFPAAETARALAALCRQKPALLQNKWERREQNDSFPGSAVYMNVFDALGANPTAMSWSEVFTAIQQGTIDGQENSCSITKSAKMDEVQKYMTTGYGFQHRRLYRQGQTLH